MHDNSSDPDKAISVLLCQSDLLPAMGTTYLLLLTQACLPSGGSSVSADHLDILSRNLPARHLHKQSLAGNKCFFEPCTLCHHLQGHSALSLKGSLLITLAFNHVCDTTLSVTATSPSLPPSLAPVTSSGLQTLVAFATYPSQF